MFNTFNTLLTRISSLFLSLLFILCPISLRANEIDIASQELEPFENLEIPKQMTKKEMNDLFGEDPYLGQTSYLQSPDGFTQRDKTK